MLDTDVSSYLIKGRSATMSPAMREIGPETLCVSVITRAELLYGLKRLSPDHRLHLGVRRFLGLVHVLPWDDEAAEHDADIRHRLALAGQPIGTMDTMIAAHSLAADAVLVTNNMRHFERIGPPLLLKSLASFDGGDVPARLRGEGESR